MTERSRTCFDRLVPVSDRYADLPVADAFSWTACEDEVAPGEWYMVAFRSTRRPGADEARLTAHDAWAHDEAMQAPGFVHYFKGPTTAEGRCMSFCLWDSRAEARAAAGRPAHRDAVALTHESYAEYTLEFHRVRRLEGDGGFTFEPYDPFLAERGRDGGARVLTPRLAPS
jgi:heme-degrading monooxygenase HmoA